MQAGPESLGGALYAELGSEVELELDVTQRVGLVNSREVLLLLLLERANRACLSRGVVCWGWHWGVSLVLTPDGVKLLESVQVCGWAFDELISEEQW